MYTKLCTKSANFYPQGASDACRFCTGNSHHRVSVSLGDTRWYCIKTAKSRITQTAPRYSPETLVF